MDPFEFLRNFYAGFRPYQPKNYRRENQPAASEITAKANSFADKAHALGITGLTREDLFNIAVYIEDTLPRYKEMGIVYLRKEDTGLARTIEYHPDTGDIYVHLKTHGGLTPLGSGSFKRVTKSILYHAENPALVACAVSDDDSLSAEADLLSRLKGKVGVVAMRSLSTHTKKNGKHVQQMVMKLYNKGSLEDGGNYSFKEKISMACDILRGAEAVKEIGYKHLDMKPGNVLLHKEKDGTMHAVIADMGIMHKIGEKLPFPHGTPLFTPPNMMVKTPQNKKEVEKVDLYPIGCVLHKIIKGRDPKWFDRKNYDAVFTERKMKKKKEAKKITKGASKELSKAMKKVRKERTPQQKAEKVVYKLLDTGVSKNVESHVDLSWAYRKLKALA